VHWVHYERDVGAQVATFGSSTRIDGMRLLAVLDAYATAGAALNMHAETLEEARTIGVVDVVAARLAGHRRRRSGAYATREWR
jgi:hypothetical protein